MQIAGSDDRASQEFLRRENSTSLEALRKPHRYQEPRSGQSERRVDGILALSVSVCVEPVIFQCESSNNYDKCIAYGIFFCVIRIIIIKECC